MAEIKPGTFGNLYSYKTYTRPTAKRLYGSFSYRKKDLSTHHKNVQKMLHILAVQGPLTTWGMAKIELANEMSKVRTREKQYRKLLVGREDRGRHSPGVTETGLVVVDGVNKIKVPANIYRLSLHGILYCLDVLDLTNKEIDLMAKNYSHILPKVFGYWDNLKKTLGSDVYRIRLLARGIFLDNIQTSKGSKIPAYEILTYLSMKYLENFEHIEEKDLAEQISYWYFTQLLIPRQVSKKGHRLKYEKWYKLVLKENDELKIWYLEFLDEVSKFYEDRVKFVKRLKKL